MDTPVNLVCKVGLQQLVLRHDRNLIAPHFPCRLPSQLRVPQLLEKQSLHGNTICLHPMHALMLLLY